MGKIGKVDSKGLLNAIFLLVEKVQTENCEDKVFPSITVYVPLALKSPIGKYAYASCPSKLHSCITAA